MLKEGECQARSLRGHRRGWETDGVVPTVWQEECIYATEASSGNLQYEDLGGTYVREQDILLNDTRLGKTYPSPARETTRAVHEGYGIHCNASC